jgi:hypothetical protein
MMRRVLPLILLAVALAVVASVPLSATAQADKNTHEGTFVKAMNEKEFVMSDQGKEHSHKLSADAKVLNADGKECKLADLKKGQMIRVTTKEGDMKTATKVEALRKRRD